jgi:cytochrome c-type biogenesis protein CcmH
MFTSRFGPAAGNRQSLPQSLYSTAVFKRFCVEKPANWRVFLLSLAVMLSCVAPAHAQVQTPELPPPSPEVAKRLKTLESELRCLVCQNQTLAESPAGLAGDLRREVRSLVEQGKGDAEIKAFLRDRYGDFVLYKPPVDPKTYLLWFGPFGLLIIGGVSGWMIARRRGLAVNGRNQVGEAASTVDISAPASPQQRARALLDEDTPEKDRSE